MAEHDDHDSDQHEAWDPAITTNYESCPATDNQPPRCLDCTKWEGAIALSSSPSCFKVVLAEKATVDLPQVDPLGEIAGVESNERLLDSSGLASWRLRFHELFLLAAQPPATEMKESLLGSRRSKSPFFFNESPSSSNSSNGSSLFGSPRALSTGVWSTSSEYYGCDSTSSSRGGSPFGSSRVVRIHSSDSHFRKTRSYH